MVGFPANMQSFDAKLASSSIRCNSWRKAWVAMR